MSGLDVLVVSYGDPAPLTTMLASLPTGLGTVRVWDNASPSSSQVREVATRWPDVDWTFCDANLGFAAAVNRLMSGATGDVLLVNPDAVVSGSPHRMLELLRQDRVAAVAPAWTSPSRQPWDNCRRFPDAFRTLVDHAGLAPKVRTSPLRSRGPLYATRPDRVDWATGACLAISRAAWADVGAFDEDFWLYGEEVDWCLRAARRGWSVRWTDELSFTHSAMGTVPDPADRRASLDRLRQSQLRLLAKHRGSVSAVVTRAGMAGWDRMPAVVKPGA